MRKDIEDLKTVLAKKKTHMNILIIQLTIRNSDIPWSREDEPQFSEEEIRFAIREMGDTKVLCVEVLTTQIVKFVTEVATDLLCIIDNASPA